MNFVTHASTCSIPTYFVTISFSLWLLHSTCTQKPTRHFPVCDTENDPGWGWLGLACETTSNTCTCVSVYHLVSILSNHYLCVKNVLLAVRKTLWQNIINLFFWLLLLHSPNSFRLVLVYHRKVMAAFMALSRSSHFDSVQVSRLHCWQKLNVPFSTMSFYKIEI